MLCATVHGLTQGSGVEDSNDTLQGMAGGGGGGALDTHDEQDGGAADVDMRPGFT